MLIVIVTFCWCVNVLNANEFCGLFRFLTVLFFCVTAKLYQWATTITHCYVFRLCLSHSRTQNSLSVRVCLHTGNAKLQQQQWQLPWLAAFIPSPFPLPCPLSFHLLRFPPTFFSAHTQISAMCLRVCFAIAISISVTVVARIWEV